MSTIDPSLLDKEVALTLDLMKPVEKLLREQAIGLRVDQRLHRQIVGVWQRLRLRRRELPIDDDVLHVVFLPCR